MFYADDAENKVVMTSVQLSCQETGAAEFNLPRGWLGLFRALGTRLQVKDVRGKDFCVRVSWWGEYFYSMYPKKGSASKRVN